jgi:hypothetical protein
VKLLKLKHCSDHSKSLGPIDEAGHLDKAAKEIQSNSNVEILTLLDVFASPQTNLAARRYPLAVDDYVQFSRRIPQITHMRTAQRLEFTIPSRRCGDRTNRERFDMTISPKVFAEHEADHTFEENQFAMGLYKYTWSPAAKITFSIHSLIHSFTHSLCHLSFTMSFSAFCSFALFGASVVAQQYAGDYIPGSLPQRSGSEISDPSGANDHLTLINYYSLGSNGQRIQPSNVQRAVIMMSGQRRDADQYIGYVSALLKSSPLNLASNRIYHRPWTLWPLPTLHTAQQKTTSPSLRPSSPTT